MPWPWGLGPLLKRHFGNGFEEFTKIYIMNQFSTIQLSLEGKIASLQLHQSAANCSISFEKILEINKALDIIEDQSDVRILVFTSGKMDFCTGIAPSQFGLMDEQPHVNIFHKWEKLCRRVERLNKHTIAVVQGTCLGVGLQLLMTCDVSLVTSDTHFEVREVKEGMIPGIALLNLAKYIGLGRAKQLLIEAQPFTAANALEWGLVGAVYPKNVFEQRVQTYLEEHLEVKVTATRLTRRLLLEAFSTSYEDFVGNYLAAQHRAINREEFLKFRHHVLSN